jgi:uncharacterized protein (DUF1684 family)
MADEFAPWSLIRYRFDVAHETETIHLDITLPGNPLTLAHWRRTVAEMYAVLRQSPPAEQARACEVFRSGRDRLWAQHSQSPLRQEQRQAFTGLKYFPYEPGWRTIGIVDRKVAPEQFVVDLAAEGHLRYARVARVHFEVQGVQGELSLFWLQGYGGGLFLPFRDATCGQASYGGGRYLYDTIKGADLGAEDLEVVLDFNYAYNPSCAYNGLWVCPLAPPENTLPFAVEAGEKAF